jgi:OmpA-OmpF porin, OOP family
MGQRLLVGVVVVSVACIAAAQSSGSLRWRAGSAPLGLQAGQPGVVTPCGSFSISCDAATLPLYLSATKPRSLSMQVIGYSETPAALANPRSPGLNVSLVGKAGLGWDLGVYGRVGTSFNRASTALTPVAPADGRFSYGVGLNWDFSRSASAAVGLDSYELRGTLGDVRELRTSLGLRWRY